jgi:hypothetical protein
LWNPRQRDKGEQANYSECRTTCDIFISTTDAALHPIFTLTVMYILIYAKLKEYQQLFRCKMETLLMSIDRAPSKTINGSKQNDGIGYFSLACLPIYILNAILRNNKTPTPT